MAADPLRAINWMTFEAGFATSITMTYRLLDTASMTYSSVAESNANLNGAPAPTISPGQDQHALRFLSVHNEDALSGTEKVSHWPSAGIENGTMQVVDTGTNCGAVPIIPVL